MNILNYLLIKESFLDQLKDEMADVGKMFKDFFLMIKEATYDVVVNWIGGDATNLLLIAIIVIIIMIVCLAIINR